MRPLAPTWLDDVAKQLFLKMRRQYDPDLWELLAIYTQCLSDYRTSLANGDGVAKKRMLDQIFKFYKLLHSGKQPEADQTDSLDEFLGDDNE